MDKIRSNGIVGQSGGPTSAINATLSGVIRGSRGKLNKLYGMQNGIAGLLEGKIVELNPLFEDEEALSCLELTPAAALGSCRFKLPKDLKSYVYEEIFKVFDKYEIGYFFYIGGNDSMDTVAKLSAYAKEKRIDVSIIGIPKTIDNDLVLTDHTPGYGSAAKYVATTVYELARDIAAYSQPSVTIVEVMGREAGWIGCACALSSHYFGKGADLIYLPEMEFSVEGFLDDVRSLLCCKNNLLVCVSEGISLENGDNTLDPFGHKQLAGVGKLLEVAVRKAIGCKVRSIELNLPQRCSGHLTSATDITESVRIGKRAVEVALMGQSGKMVAFKRKAGEYAVEIDLVDATIVANAIKHVPAEFIDNEHKTVTEKCIEYIAPLIMGETRVKYVMGLPHHFDLEGYLCTK